MKTNEADKILGKIKDGSILEELVDYSELRIKTTSIKPFEDIIYFNKKGILPRIKDLEKISGRNYYSLRYHHRKLEDRKILCSFSFPQIFNTFGCYENRSPKLPESLDRATQEEFNKIRGHNFNKKMTKNPLATYWRHFYLALVTESDVAGRKIPVFHSIFKFLPYYQTEPFNI